MPLQQLLRRYLWIDGRSGRREWWRIMILCLILGWMFSAHSIFAIGFYRDDASLVVLGRIAVTLLLFWIDLASTIRRLHDRGKSGWAALPFIFPGFGWMWMVIECGMLPSNKGYNRYGPEPGSAGDKLAATALYHAMLAELAGRSSGPWTTRAAPAPAQPAVPAPARFAAKSQKFARAAGPEAPRASARSQHGRTPTVSVIRRGDAGERGRIGAVLVIGAVAIAGFLFMAYAMGGITPDLLVFKAD